MPGKRGDSDQDSDVEVITDTGEQAMSRRQAAEAEEEDEDCLIDAEEEDDPCEQPNVVWTGYGKRVPILIFKAEALVSKHKDHKNVGERYHMAYKMVKTECKLIRSVLSSHGFHEVHPNSNDFNMMWTGSHLKPYTLRGLQEFQKVNHFPRSYEITRKDRLYKNVQRMQQTKGFRNFDFVPQSFIIPTEFQDFCSAFLKDKGPWIVKPVASSRGRGIFLVNHPEQVPLDETMIVSRYVPNPLLIDGFKFDIRLYVAVTSYDPLIVYLYEEGLVRFATVKYDKNTKNIRNQCMHLTNYSVNKKNAEYVRNDDPDVEDYGNKWSLGAMLRYLRSQGKDTTALMMRIEDVINKTLVAAELPIATACKMFMPFRGNCFEVYGFDILLDENLRPWVLEVNLSPSLACDSPLDLKIKSNMISDLFSLTGFICHDPMVRKLQQSRRNHDTLANSRPRAQSAKTRPNSACTNRWKKYLPKSRQRGRPQSAAGRVSYTNARNSLVQASGTGLTGEEIRIIRRSKEEFVRRGGWVRIFPTPDSWELYGSYLQSNTTHNFMLYSQLYPERAKSLSAKPSTAAHNSAAAKTKSFQLHSSQHPQLQFSQMDDTMAHILNRSLQYERKLSAIGQRQQRNKIPLYRRPPEGASVTSSTSQNGSLAQGVMEERVQDQSRTDDPNPSITLSQSRQRDPTPPVTSQPPSIKVDRKRDPSPAPKPQPSSIPPRHSPSKNNFNVVTLLEKGLSLSKVQARFAFATYLTRVQERLLAETTSSDMDDVDAANEQMDLVLRFLKRAAGNLQQSFKVIVPSHKLPLSDRRRILAKQLYDFVQIYNKETDQLKQRTIIEKKHLKRPPSFSKLEGLDEDKFSHFVHNASETELEDVLTTYTKLNKSASIFLGSNSKSSYEGNGLQASHSTTETHLSRRREAEHHPGLQKSPSMLSDNTLSSYPNAVLIYSAKLGSNSKARPLSASSQKSLISSGKSRPMSAALSRMNSVGSSPYERERPDGAESKSGQHDEEAINTALQRLAARQQQRKYAAGANVLEPEVSAGVHRSRTMSWNDDRQSTDYPNPARERSRSTQRPLTANDTFNNFVGYDEFYAKLSSYDDLQAQSRNLLQQSKAKHQAMVAQAHAAYKSIHDDEGAYVPKPPSKPADRKPSSAHRLARMMLKQFTDRLNFGKLSPQVTTVSSQ